MRSLLGAVVALALAGPAARTLAMEPVAGMAKAEVLAAVSSCASAEGAGDLACRLGDGDGRRYARYDESDLQRARRAVGALQRADPGLRRLFEQAVGYAVFGEMGTRGASDGVGVLYEEGQAAGKAILPSSPASLRSDGQPYAQVVFFGTRQAVASFKQVGLAPAAQARAVAVVTGGTAKIRYVEGVSAFTLGRDGGVAGSREGGQTFGYLPYHRELTKSSR
jgi:hypothetical protein